MTENKLELKIVILNLSAEAGESEGSHFQSIFM